MDEIVKVVEGCPPRTCRYWVEVAGVSVAYYDHASPTEAQKLAAEIAAALREVAVPRERVAGLVEAVELAISTIKDMQAGKAMQIPVEKKLELIEEIMSAYHSASRGEKNG